MNIRLRFVRGNGLTSHLIAWFSQSHLSHVDAVMPDGTLMGARSDNVGGGKGVRRRPYPYEDVAEVVLMELPASPEQTRDFYSFIAGQDGKPYDHLAIWGFFLNRNWHDGDAWFCSELISAALIAAKWMESDAFIQANKITPALLRYAVSQRGGKVVASSIDKLPADMETP